MAIQTIGIGSAPNDGTGDTARAAFGKVNANFAESSTEHGYEGSGQYAHIVHKIDINSTDAAARSSVIAGGGDSGSSTRANEPGITGCNEIGAHASYVAGTAHYSTIGGGYDNRNDHLAGTISGGAHNLLSYQGSHGWIGGGSHHAILGDSDYCTIGGGTSHVVGATSGGDANTIAGGHTNAITRGVDNSISGGRSQAISSSGTGGNTIAGGNGNTISGSGSYASVGGGTANAISASGNGNVIVGGSSNAISGAASYGLVAGQSNTISTGTSSVVVGNSNTGANNYEVVFGYRCASLTDCDGGVTFSGDGNPWSGSAGASQAFSFTQSGSTTDSSTRTYLTNRSTSVPTVPLNSAVMGRITLLGKRTGTGSVVGYVCDFIVSRGSSGTITVEQENWTAIKDEPTVGGAPIIRAGVTTLAVGVLGASGVTIRWTARLDCVVVVAP